jgi:hypothetical protein
MAAVVYILGAMSSLLCCILLLRRFAGSGQRLLLWSGLCFAGLTATNLIVFVDLVVLPDIDLHLLRLTIASISMSLLLFGLIWESK